ncbi:DUF1376 domain-containing protein [Sinorhizobium meliloti]|uniref:DUF1376 domain-containing protein n=1 Tax=Rhizobium meliloti TaxID=382 RepID=UPI000FDA3318|nr:DUF1376 domain-containing protein [Sinorhizobium meliloti]RVO34826.1 DUF1376 domain-containing protein [Sinorhizobium meliloti]
MGKAKARRVDFYPDEYIAGVGGVLRADEQGVYWMICTLIMSEGGVIEQSDRRLAALCQIRPADVRKLVDGLVAKGKIVRQSDGKLSQKRAENEVERSLNRIQTASENGSNGGRPSGKTQVNQRNVEAGGYSAEKLTTNHQPSTINQKEKEEPSGSSKKQGSRLSPDWSLPDEWQAYAVKKGLPSRRIEVEAEKFKNHWLQQSGQRGVKADWYATWRNWVLNSLDGFGKPARPATSERYRDINGDLTNDYLFGRG